MLFRSIYVTHDQIEAMTLADRIVLLRDGQIEQIGTPLDLFERPANLFVAGFLGSPRMNFVPVTLADGAVVLADGTRLAHGKPAGQGGQSGQAALLGLRPQNIALAAGPVPPGHARVRVTVELVQPTGTRVHVTLPLGGINLIAELGAHEVSAPGQRVEIDIDMDRALLIDPHSEQVL